MDLFDSKCYHNDDSIVIVCIYSSYLVLNSLDIAHLSAILSTIQHVYYTIGILLHQNINKCIFKTKGYRARMHTSFNNKCTHVFPLAIILPGNN